jgi:hypothetical protein
MTEEFYTNSSASMAVNELENWPGAGAAVITTESITSYYQLHHPAFCFVILRAAENEKKEKLLPQLQLLPDQVRKSYLFKLETYLK